MINYEKGVVKYSSQFVVSQIIQVCFSYCRVKRLLVSHVQQTMLSFLCSRPRYKILINSCSTTVAVMVIMEEARLLFSASCITGNVRWPHEHENYWCFDWVKKLCNKLKGPTSLIVIVVSRRKVNRIFSQHVSKVSVTPSSMVYLGMSHESQGRQVQWA